MKQEMKIATALKTKYPWVLIGLLMVFYFMVIHKLVSKPLIGWEVLAWDLSKHIFKHDFSAIDLFVHPTFFGYFGMLNFKLFGISESSLRLTGIFSFLGTLLLLPILVRSLLDEKDYTYPAAIAILLFTLSPLVVQGSLANDMTDTGLLVLATVLFFVAYYAFYNAGIMKRILALGIVYGFCLCAKITTNLALPLSIFIFYCLRRKWREGGALSLGMFIVGILVFSLSWFLNCFLLDRLAEFPTPFLYVLSSFAGSATQVHQGIGSRLLTWLLTLFRMGMWLTPFFIVLTAIAVFFQVRQFISQKILYEENQLLVYSAIVFFVYVLANGVVHGGFPKYIAPIIPVLCVYIGLTLHRFNADRPVFWFWGVVFACGCFYYYYVIGDSLYPTFLIRKYSYTGAQRIFSIVASFALKELLFPAVLIIAVLMAKQYSTRKLLLILFVSLCANNAATLVAQSKAVYATGEAYGSEGAEAVKQFYLKNKIIYVCREGVVATKDYVEFRVIPAKAWKDAMSFYTFMEQRRPQFLVYGLACNTLAQMRIMETSPIRDYLDQHYHRSIAGEYVLCQRIKKIKEF